ncbi:two-component system sensor histidine kinase YesM [Mobilisporobacter senegalensis]|uniref:Two-component system sensor histidine kinase YesM n=1 Tax=Mobilisporobacter senegalensis TaxID=1329262 RepID=A0A3N1XLD0_9FIRM|nr:sensor histidine kinase [Mobilisporobacter senegalensis]ROR27513.1 two-component system sensor histidine kinase YesM [Mobilisporobacter senegalensis]
MKWIKNKIMNCTIRSKIILSYLFIGLIPFLIFAIISTLVYTNQVQNNISQHTNQMLGQVKTAIEVYINSLDKLTNYINKEVDSVDFNKIYTEDDIEWKFEKETISDMLYNIADTHPEIGGILIATENDMYISTGMTRISRDSFTKEIWYKQAVQNQNEIQIISNVTGRNIVTNESYSVDDVFSVSKAIINRDTGEVCGVILMDIRHDIIQESIQSITIGEKGFVFVIDDNQHVVYTPLNPITYRVNPDWFEENEGQPIITRINYETYQIRCEYSDYTKWKIVGVFSQDEIMSSMYTMMYILIGILWVVLISIIIFSLKISQTITKPIIKLKKIMKKAESGDLSVRFNAYYQDEISELGRNFNHMIMRIEKLVQLVYIEQRNKRKAELKVLQEQIKPHFLYNTLDTISWMAREYEADDIVKLVDALTNMFRIGLSHGNDYIKIAEEIKYVSNYLYIQKIRYRSKLNYQIEVDESIENFEVPKLILQPLVENAIYHGIKTKRGEGNLLITALRLDRDSVRFCVEDDGSGMEEKTVEELNRLLNQPTKLDDNQSFGLFYIKERLRIRYGDYFSVKVESRINEGTKIIITIRNIMLYNMSNAEGENIYHEK